MADKFTAEQQEHVNQLLRAQKAPLKKRVEDLEQQLAAYETLKTELTAAGEDLTRQVQALTAERDAFAGERDAARAELQSVHAAHAQAVGAVRQTALQVQLATALNAANAHPQSIGAALRELTREAQLELDDAGSIVGIRLGDATHTDPVAAARAFLEAQPWFAKGSVGGAGASRPTGFGVSHPAADLPSAAELMRAGLEQKP